MIRFSYNMNFGITISFHSFSGLYCAQLIHTCLDSQDLFEARRALEK